MWQKEPHTDLPPPTDTTHIKLDMEDGQYRDLKKYWFEAIHSCDEKTDWRLVEKNNALTKYNSYQDLDDESSIKSSKTISVANGSLIGKWEEKGSINQAGNIRKTTYNSNEDKIYAISDGGSLWKGDLTTHQWEVVEQNLRMDGNFLDITYPSEGDTRIIASIGGVPYYYLLEENIWRRAEGIATDQIYNIKNQLATANGQHIFYLAKPTSSLSVRLYHSSDFGVSYQVVKEFLTHYLDNLQIALDSRTNELFVIEQVSSAASKILLFDAEKNTLETVIVSSPISFGNEGKANLEVFYKNGTRWFLSYTEDNRMKLSANNGSSWVNHSSLPTTPWEAGIHVSKKNPNIMILGAIEAYRTINGGLSWTKINEWYEYYNNPSTTLHADIMYMDEFTDKDGQDVILVSNHGGISKSVDSGEDFINIGLVGLNTSQYYSVKTYPHNQNYIFAGSQDQGIQRCKDLGEGPETFHQFYSGDYGHLQFTNYGRSLWTIFPGGEIYYASNPLSNDKPKSYHLLSNNQSVWLPPIITSPYNPNSILVAGGSLLGSTGSHIVELTVDDLSQFFGQQWGHDFSKGGGEISAMAYNQVRTNEFYVMTTNGKFYKSKNKGGLFEEKDMNLSEAHHLYGNTILSSKKDARTVLVGGSGYNNHAVFISTDGTETFKPMAKGLPRTTVFEMAFSPDEEFIFAATEAGPYVYVRQHNQWYDLAQGKAPNQRYWSVEYLNSLNKVRFGTYGRGIWDLEIEKLSQLAVVEAKQTLLVYPNPSKGAFKLQKAPNKGKLTLLNSEGKLIFIKNLEKGDAFDFDLMAFPNGMYYIIFDDGTQKSSSVIVKT